VKERKKARAGVKSHRKRQTDTEIDRDSVCVQERKRERERKREKKKARKRGGRGERDEGYINRVREAWGGAGREGAKGLGLVGSVHGGQKGGGRGGGGGRLLDKGRD